jgi:hypothetical protein
LESSECKRLVRVAEGVAKQTARNQISNTDQDEASANCAGVKSIDI